MVAGCGSNIIKYILFFFNFLFFIIGAAAVGIGIWALVDKTHMAVLSKVTSDTTVTDYNVPGLLQSGAIVLIVGGGVLLVMGFLGCCGAAKEITCLLCLYATLLVVILIVEIAAGILAAVMKNKFESELKKNLIINLDKNYDGKLNSSDVFSRAIDWAQVYFQCCGIQYYTDFENATKWKVDHGSDKVPDTCCVLKNRDDYLNNNILDLKNSSCPATPTENNSYMENPCYGTLRQWLVDRAVVILGIAFGIVGLEIFGIIFACCLIRAIKEQKG